MIPSKPVTSPPVIGVLTPQTGGFYYGTVLNGILRAARKNGAVAIAFETSRLSLLQGQQVLSATRIDGWLAVNEFEDTALLEALRSRGATIVHLHSKPDVASGSAVLPDNEGGARAVTTHLIEHGHRRIAFAGNLGHVDVGERLLGYRGALESAGIEGGEGWIFDTPHHKHVDGRRVARALISGRKRGSAHAEPHVPSGVTALVAATDRLALGAMAVLSAAGIRVPDDFALVGFDDSESAQYAEPPLTTVRQSFPEAAACAVDELLNALKTKGSPRPLVRVPAHPIIRRSCGCELSRSLPPRLSDSSRSRVRDLTRELLAFAGRHRLGAVNLTEWPEAEKIATALEATAYRSGTAEAVRGRWWAGFLAQSPDAESAVRVMELLEATVRAWSTRGETESQAWGLLRELRVALMHQWQRGERSRVAHYESVTEAAYRLANSLSNTNIDPSEDLRWIRWSKAQHACCALWELAPGEGPPGTDGSPPSLRLTGEYRDSGGNLRSPTDAQNLTPSQFPPQRMLDTAAREGAIVTVAGVPNGKGEEYGLLAVVAPLDFEHLQYVGTPGDWGVQLGSALDRLYAERKLRASAEQDSLTGLANRSTLLSRIEALRCAQDNPPFALLFIDLDDFKKVNDSLGHEAGDQLLVQIAERLGQAMQECAPKRSQGKSLVARVGGDEFVVVLDGISDEPSAVAAVEFLQERLRQPYGLHGRTVFVSASIGVNFGQGTQSSAQELLRDADTAMYRAKKQGRARHEIFHHGMHAQAVEKLHLDARLRLALAHNELELWYQPIVDLITGGDVGAEALIRWRHPEQGLLSPDRFLPIAEEVGLEIPISEWVLRRACQDAARWQRTYGPVLYINVNVPPAHIKHPGFVSVVERALAESGLRPEALGVELVEDTLLDEPEKCTLALSRVRDLGVRVALDDFGTGYSNLSYLRDFPVNTLKIDRSFVRNVPGNPQDNGIARAIIAMGQELGLSIVAEGIETPEQFHFLKRAGCDYAQGYLMSMPLDEATYTARLAYVRTAAPPTSGEHHDKPTNVPDGLVG